MLKRIHHPAFSDELYFTKGGYLGVAELYNGGEMYLYISYYGNFYDITGKFGHYNYLYILKQKNVEISLTVKRAYDVYNTYFKDIKEAAIL